MRRPGGFCGVAAPDPIPNSAVKRPSAHDTSSQDAGKSVAARFAHRIPSLPSTPKRPPQVKTCGGRLVVARPQTHNATPSHPAAQKPVAYRVQTHRDTQRRQRNQTRPRQNIRASETQNRTALP
nr:hypothetical protein [Aureimonas sp. AU4]